MEKQQRKGVVDNTRRVKLHPTNTLQISKSVYPINVCFGFRFLSMRISAKEVGIYGAHLHMKFYPQMIILIKADYAIPDPVETSDR